MSEYDIKKAGNRLLWRFTHKENNDIKAFKPNETDIQALKTVLSRITSQKKEIALNQRLFAKLYIYNFSEFMRKYDTTVLEKELQKDLSRVLAMPLNLFYEAFYKDLVSRQFEKIIEDNERITGKLLTKEDLKGIYTEDFVNNILEYQVTEAYERFANLD